MAVYLYSAFSGRLFDVIAVRLIMVMFAFAPKTMDVNYRGTSSFSLRLLPSVDLAFCSSFHQSLSHPLPHVTSDDKHTLEHAHGPQYNRKKPITHIFISIHMRSRNCSAWTSSLYI